ncbi:MAG TPA: glycosyltransferase family 4 protein, partial [Opitutaceae bacterium]
EHVYQAAARLLRRPYSYFAAHDRMARRIVRDFAPPKVLLAIDTGAESLFRAWQGKVRRVLDLTIAVPQYRAHIFSAAEADPRNAGVSFHHPGGWELTRYAAEVQLADLILCPSDFVMDSCRFVGVPESRLRLLPYGFDPGVFAPPDTPPAATEPLCIVFVGTFCTRKGSHLLLPAFASVRAAHPEAELHVFGDVQDAPAATPPGVVFHGRIPQPELALQLRRMHLMAFPTLFEGSAYAVYQALASGVPVITTRNCGSIVDDSCGVLLREPDAAGLRESLLRLAGDRAALHRLALAAPARVRDYTWMNYGSRLQEILCDAFPEVRADLRAQPQPSAA